MRGSLSVLSFYKKGISKLFILTALLVFSTNTYADWKDDIGTFRIGIVGGSDPSEVIAKVEPFRLALEEALQVPVAIVPSPDLRSLVRSHFEGRNEYAVLSPSAYAAGWANCECIEPLVVAKSSDASSGVYSIIISRKDGNISNTSHLSGKQIMTMGENSTLGYSFPIHQLQRQKIDLTSGGTQMLFPNSGEDALRRFAAGEGDALMGWTSKTGDAANGYSRGSLSQLEEIAPGILEKIRTIWTSNKIPHRVHSIRKNLAGEPKRLLRQLLSTLFENDPIAFDAIEPEFGGGFEISSQSDFNELVEFAKNAVPSPLESKQDNSPNK